MAVTCQSLLWCPNVAPSRHSAASSNRIRAHACGSGGRTQQWACNGVGGSTCAEGDGAHCEGQPTWGGEGEGSEGGQDKTRATDRPTTRLHICTGTGREIICLCIYLSYRFIYIYIYTICRTCPVAMAASFSLSSKGRPHTWACSANTSGLTST